jgi:hypothetical protein
VNACLPNVRPRWLAALALAFLPLLLGSCSGEKEEEPIDAEEIDVAAILAEQEKQNRFPWPKRERSGPLFSWELLMTVVEELGDEARGAYPLQAHYRFGNEDLEFREATFLVSSPALDGKPPDKNAILMEVRNGKVVEQRRAPRGSGLSIGGFNVLPNRPIRVARQHGLREWWRTHPDAYVHARLLLRDEIEEHDLPGSGTWIWELVGAENGTELQCVCYVEAGTLRFLRKTMEHAEPSPEAE